MQTTEFKLDIGGRRLAVVDHGGAGEPLLALHGWLDNAASFRWLAPRLQGRRLLALELAPGMAIRTGSHRAAATRSGTICRIWMRRWMRLAWNGCTCSATLWVRRWLPCSPPFALGQSPAW